MRILFVILVFLSACHGTSVLEDGSGASTDSNGPSPAASQFSNSLEDHFFIGSVSEDSPGDLSFWGHHFVPARYIYINGGFSGGWRTWGIQDGDRAVRFIQNSFNLKMVPFFVYYQIPGGGGESYGGDLANIQNPAFMRDYFLDLKFFLEIVRREGGEEAVGIILEPDFLGYMMQQSGKRPEQIVAQVAGAYAAGVLGSGDPSFPNNVKGLVEAIGTIIRKYAPNALFGWQINLWASPGIHHSVPGNGLCRISDTMGILGGRQAIRDEAREIALYYKEAGILSQDPKWVFADKYGLDGAGSTCPDPNRDPSSCIWFWNSDHWNNYIAFLEALHKELQRPVILWQIPIGHINDSKALNPTTGKIFPVLRNEVREFEDSAPTFIFGDSFQSAIPERLRYFGDVLDPKTSKNGNQISILSHADEFVAAGVVGILFGAGTGLSTDFDTDGLWWISKVEDYYRQGPKKFR